MILYSYLSSKMIYKILSGALIRFNFKKNKKEIIKLRGLKVGGQNEKNEKNEKNTFCNLKKRIIFTTLF